MVLWIGGVGDAQDSFPQQPQFLKRGQAGHAWRAGSLFASRHRQASITAHRTLHIWYDDNQVDRVGRSMERLLYSDLTDNAVSKPCLVRIPLMTHYNEPVKPRSPFENTLKCRCS